RSATTDRPHLHLGLVLLGVVDDLQAIVLGAIDRERWLALRRAGIDGIGLPLAEGIVIAIRERQIGLPIAALMAVVRLATTKPLARFGQYLLLAHRIFTVTRSSSRFACPGMARDCAASWCRTFARW